MLLKCFQKLDHVTGKQNTLWLVTHIHQSDANVKSKFEIELYGTSFNISVTVI